MCSRPRRPLLCIYDRSKYYNNNSSSKDSHHVYYEPSSFNYRTSSDRYMLRRRLTSKTNPKRRTMLVPKMGPASRRPILRRYGQRSWNFSRSALYIKPSSQKRLLGSFSRLYILRCTSPYRSGLCGGYITTRTSSSRYFVQV